MARIPTLAVALLLALLIVTLFTKNGPNRWANKTLGFVPIALSLYLTIHHTYNLVVHKCVFAIGRGVDICSDSGLFYISMFVRPIFYLIIFAIGVAFLRGWGDAPKDRRGAL